MEGIRIGPGCTLTNCTKNLMEQLTLKLAELDLINPADFAIVMWVGSDDTLLQDGNQIIEAARTDGGIAGATLSQALVWQVSEMSGNSFEMIVLHSGMLHELKIDWGDDE